MNARIMEMNPDANQLTTSEGKKIEYAYALLSTGSKTNFYHHPYADKCMKLDTVDDAMDIHKALQARMINNSDKPLTVVVVGGGYTGIEAATHAQRFIDGKVKNSRVIVVEKESDILPANESWVRKIVQRELFQLGISVICSDTLSYVNEDRITLGSGITFENAICIWSAGIRVSDYLAHAQLPVNGRGVEVNPSLLVKAQTQQNVFAAGDAASVAAPGSGMPLRNAVMFSLAQGKTAARNIISSIHNRALISYRPRDLGWLIPLAHGKAPGRVLDQRVGGRVGYFLHYLMCVYRSRFPNNLMMLRQVLRNRLYKNTLKQ
mgnify:CR=1 FL=1